MKRATVGVAGRLPAFAPGMRIGLYGGSFDPPHPGHRHVAATALRRLRLDRVWWLVSPGNPLKDVSRLTPRDERVRASQAFARHPRMAAIAPEPAGRAAYTFETVRELRRRGRGVRFVWLMGADSLAGFHRWRAWREIAALVPIAVIDRPGWGLTAAASRAAVALGPARVPEAEAATLADRRPPAWTFLHGPRSHHSSTRLRQGR